MRNSNVEIISKDGKFGLSVGKRSIVIDTCFDEIKEISKNLFILNDEGVLNICVLIYDCNGELIGIQIMPKEEEKDDI